MVRRKDKKAAKTQASTTEFPREESRFTVVIVGGGASGIAAACAIGKIAKMNFVDVRVVILERGRRIGASILRSGNGRCNFSHEGITPEAYNRPVFVEQVFEALDTAFTLSPLAESLGQLPGGSSEDAVLQWFQSLGLVWTESAQNEGALYPFSNKATSVLEVLAAELDRCGVERYCGIEVFNIAKISDRYSLDLGDALAEGELAQSPQAFHADMVVYAVGGALRADVQPTGVLGALDWIPSVPVLGPLQTDTALLKDLDGMRAKVRLRCTERGFSEEGELLFRPYGVSGIVVFDASRFVEPGDTIVVDLAPDYSLDQLEEFLFERSRVLMRRNGYPHTYRELLRGFFLPELAESLVASGLAELPSATDGLDSEVSGAGITLLSTSIKAFSLKVTDRGSVDQSQLSRGGISVEDVVPTTMEAYVNPGFYVTGEVIDVDGPCGGYNLHWAWATGLLAGISLMQEHSFRSRISRDYSDL
ncbi:NAD(P)/FAD-dependent oxidoreductase [Anaerotardibacter muris]|uniref:NAD(P)/FAD-dependent oxidoreductase n=1 Tax=Anaerotardibacter muris TaxID=2941505 RepID=UPI00203D9FC4|nr:NAD(P)/FAD-dependent oxidoreductase [Anaerotardibacter muris]